MKLFNTMFILATALPSACRLYEATTCKELESDLESCQVDAEMEAIIGINPNLCFDASSDYPPLLTCYKVSKDCDEITESACSLKHGGGLPQNSCCLEHFLDLVSCTTGCELFEGGDPLAGHPCYNLPNANTVYLPDSCLNLPADASEGHLPPDESEGHTALRSTENENGAYMIGIAILITLLNTMAYHLMMI